jgi:hypothetical protein
MPQHVRFTARFDYRVPRKHGVTVAYPEGWAGIVPRDCAKKAIACKVAEPIEPPARPAKAGVDA